MATTAIIALIFAILGTAASVGTGIYANAQNQRIAEENWNQANASREDSQQFAAGQQENANRATINMFNTLDSPEARVQQLKNAGLSVGLMYGQGGTGGTHSSAMAGAPAGGAANVAPFINPLVNLQQNPTEAIKELVEAEKASKEGNKAEKEAKKVDYEITEIIANTKKIEEQAKTEAVTRNFTNTQNKLAEKQLEFETATLDKRIEMVDENVNLIKQNVNKTRQEVKGLRIDNQYKGQLYQSTLNLNEELQKKYIAETAKAVADEVLAKAEAKLTDAKTELTKEQKKELEQLVRQEKVKADEYEEYGYKVTEANNWATELMALARSILSYITDKNNEDVLDEAREEQKKEIQEAKAQGKKPNYGTKGFHKNGQWY